MATDHAQNFLLGLWTESRAKLEEEELDQSGWLSSLVSVLIAETTVAIVGCYQRWVHPPAHSDGLLTLAHMPVPATHFLSQRPFPFPFWSQQAPDR